MITINTSKILVPIDFSKTSMKAAKKAAAMAKIAKGELILLHIQKKTDLIDILIPALKIKDISIVTQFLEEKLATLAHSIATSFEIKVTSVVSIGNITSEIVKIASDYKAGLIFMGTQGSDSTNDLFLGSNSYRLLTKSNIPIITVTDKVNQTDHKTILLPIDSSSHSRQKVDATIKLAKKFNSEIYALGLLQKSEKNYEHSMQVILNQVEKLAQSKKVICHKEIKYVETRSTATINYAKKIKAGLIVIMTDQSSEFINRITLGTYAHQLINGASVPVLSIPPENHPENVEMSAPGGLW